MKHPKTIMIAMIPACAWLLGTGQAVGQSVITEIIDAPGDGAANVLDGPIGIAVDAARNVYVPGSFSANAFKIPPAGVSDEPADAAAADRTGEMDDAPTGGAGSPGICGVVAMMGTLLMHPARADLVIQRSFGVGRICRAANAVRALYDRASGDSKDLAGAARWRQRSLAFESTGSSECYTALRSEKSEMSTDMV